MPILIALLVCAAIASSLLLLLSIEDRRYPSLMDLWAQSRLGLAQALEAPEAPPVPWFYCERTKRYRDAVTKRFIPRPV